MEHLEKQRILSFLDETKKAIEEDRVGPCLIMYNYSSAWAGDPFALKGWVNHVSEIMKIKLLAGSSPGKSPIWQPKKEKI